MFDEIELKEVKQYNLYFLLGENTYFLPVWGTDPDQIVCDMKLFHGNKIKILKCIEVKDGE
jgi:hypothetical protein